MPPKEHDCFGLEGICGCLALSRSPEIQLNRDRTPENGIERPLGHKERPCRGRVFPGARPRGLEPLTS
jgi:hypothetical protein